MKKTFILLFTAFIGISGIAQTLPSYVPNLGLNAYYDFNGNGNDKSGNLNNGTINGATLTTGKFGMSNTAYSFNGINNTVSLLNPFLGGTQNSAFSFYTRLKINSTVNTNVIWSKSFYWGEITFFVSNTNEIRVVWANSITGNKYSFIYSQPNIINVGSWYDIVVVFQGSSGQIYLNGNPIATNLQWMAQGGGILSTSVIESQCNFATDLGTSKIGVVSSSNYFNGIIDEFGVWNRALSQCEIQKLFISPALQITASPYAICSGQSIILNAGGSTNYLWSNGTSGPSTTINPTVSSIYSYTTTYSVGCFDTKTINITVNPLPIVNATASSSLICVGEATSINASGASTYTWSGGSTTQNISVSPTITTTYSVVGTNTNNCVGNATVVITVNPCTGLNNITNLATSSFIYPNPNNGLFTIETETILIKNIKIISIAGEVVYEESSKKDKITISVQDLPNGLYFIKISSNHKIETFKIVKE